jgi:hypothetical protein
LGKINCIIEKKWRVFSVFVLYQHSSVTNIVYVQHTIF